MKKIFFRNRRVECVEISFNPKRETLIIKGFYDGAVPLNDGEKWVIKLSEFLEKLGIEDRK